MKLHTINGFPGQVKTSFVELVLTAAKESGSSAEVWAFSGAEPAGLDLPCRSIPAAWSEPDALRQHAASPRAADMALLILPDDACDLRKRLIVPLEKDLQFASHTFCVSDAWLRDWMLAEGTERQQDFDYLTGKQLEEAGILAIDCGSAGLPGPQQQSCKVMAAGRFPDKLIVPFNGQNLASIKSWLTMVRGNIGIDLTARKIALNDRLKSQPGLQPGK